MIGKTSGIVLNFIKYKDTSIIAHIFTQEYGYGSFIVNSIRSQKSKKSIGLFQPFCILDLVLYIKPNRDIQHISEFQNKTPLHAIHQNLVAGSVALFLSEVLSKILQQETESNEPLFIFLEESIIQLDTEKNRSNFHIQFLLKLGSYLGFAITDFNTLFSSINKTMPSEDYETLFEELLMSPYGHTFNITREVRNQTLDAIIEYYIHHTNLKRPKSLEVLRKVLE